MNPTPGQSQRSDRQGAADQLRAAGIVLAHCNSAGDLIVPVLNDHDWLEQLIINPRIIRANIKRRAASWQHEAEPAGCEIIPGLWCEPLEIRRRKRRTGYALLLIPTMALLESEHFYALCQSASLDHAACVEQLRHQCPHPTAQDVGQVAMLGRYLIEAELRQDAYQRTMDSIGQQLAESYEEISLLYTISQSMTVVQRPQQFIRNVCEGLHDTLSYSAVGAQFADEMPSLPGLAGKLLLEGADERPNERTLSIMRRMLHFAQLDSPVVLDPFNKPEHAEFGPLGSPILLQPISREGRLVGVLFAAGKRGVDRDASSVDLKLLGAAATHTALFLENAALYEDMGAMFLGTLEAISAAIDAKDPYTCGHSQRVAHLAQELGRACGIDDQTVRRIHVAGLVHDVGKIGVPEVVLCKPGRLTDAEFEQIKQHPEIGYRILKDIPQLRDVLPGVLHHHERWDGHGYPHGLRDEQIPLFARVIALADSFDAMSSTRTYREGRERAWVLDEIRRCAGTQFDPELTEAFLSLDFAGFDELMQDQHRNDATLGFASKGEAA